MNRSRQVVDKEEVPCAKSVIVMRLMHLIGNCASDQAQDIIDDLRTHGFEIHKRTHGNEVEIERLKAELAAERDRVAYWRARDEEGRKIEEELRAELAAERKWTRALNK